MSEAQTEEMGKKASFAESLSLEKKLWINRMSLSLILVVMRFFIIIK